MNEALKKWFKAAMCRALKTFFQSGAASMCVLSVVKQFSWETTVCTAILAGLFSLLTSSLSFPDIPK
ncbi:MAG: hypothetical protein K2H90_08910 [Oscillospiraceae bacterium]|nr:hypothetical protein [Oscillospiraceae bacterium]MDE6133167.1 hypothetical protein [Oscillospiraceae bacterium]